ncbi:MAG: glutamine-hydrolyzing GMP synthase [Planctomycetota bacterium]
MAEFIAILDFGSQYTQLIARRIREHNVYCEILRHDTSAEELKQRAPNGIVLSGGPASVYEENAPRCDAQLFRLGIPTLGICYGMQLACQELGAQVIASTGSGEYGATDISLGDDILFEGVERDTTVWMSHGDRVDMSGSQLETVASTTNCPYAAVRDKDSKFWGIQFHPEVTHTARGRKILENFLVKICGCEGDWSLAKFTERTIGELREQVGDRHVVCGLSGGVDSSVVAVLLHEAIGDQLHCIFVDNGLLRKGERDEVETMFRGHYNIDLRVVDASEVFVTRLAGVLDPEVKRKSIGHTFIEVFRDEAKGLERAELLAQGTLYPDVIESISPWGGPAATIKSHHNVGGLPEELGFELVEPLRFLFKDEVRQIGRELGLPDKFVDRQPFPGPGLAVRIVGEITPDRLRTLQDADAIVRQEMETWEHYASVWQSFAVLLPIQSVGVMGDKRTYEHVIALRVVESTDGMTADWVDLPHELVARISNRICNEVDGINRVVLDVSSKPPSTIEWE